MIGFTAEQSSKVYIGKCGVCLTLAMQQKAITRICQHGTYGDAWWFRGSSSVLCFQWWNNLMIIPRLASPSVYRITLPDTRSNIAFAEELLLIPIISDPPLKLAPHCTLKVSRDHNTVLTVHGICLHVPLLQHKSQATLQHTSESVILLIFFNIMQCIY